MSDDLLIARDIEFAFGAGSSLFGLARSPVKVLHGVTIRIGRGETVGIVGESGSGKTTLGRALLRLIDVQSGTIEFDGLDITRLPEAAMRPIRRRMQLIFQDPMASLNPRHTIRRIVLEPMLFHRVAAGEADAEQRARKIFARFNLPYACLERYPHELSGGQRQRVGIARVALLAPDFVLADEIVSGSRRFNASPGLEPAEGALARPRPFHGLHQPRPLRHPCGVRPRLCAAERANC